MSGEYRRFTIRANRQIQDVVAVRVIDVEGQLLGVMSIEDALALAADRGVDLVEVNPRATPPICKLLELDRYRRDDALDRSPVDD